MTFMTRLTTMPDLMSFDIVTYVSLMTWLAKLPDLMSFNIVTCT